MARTIDEWKELLQTNESAYEDELSAMDDRETMYRGEYTHESLTSRTDEHDGQEVAYVYNVIAENIEAQVSNDIPMPKVRARRKKDEHLAEIIENMIRNELDRLPMERINDLSERVVPIQGAGMYIVEWDNTQRTHNTVGENVISFVHPKQIIPQAGVYDDIAGMDYFFRKIPQTKESIKARYGVDVSEESEEEPEVKGVGDSSAADDMVTQYTAYYRNETGGIGLFSWCNDTVLEDLEDYQARRLRRCGQCGAAEPLIGEVLSDGTEEPLVWTEGEACPVCGARNWIDTQEDWEEITGPIMRSDGTMLFGGEGGTPGLYDMTGAAPMMAGAGLGPEIPGQPVPGAEPGEETGLRSGEKVKVPYYKPNLFPVVLQRNVSVFGRLLGESDVDKIAGMQKVLNRMNQKILDRFLRSGTKIALPADATISLDAKDGNVWRLEDLADLSMIRQFDFTGDVSQQMAQVQATYQQMRQAIGVTDSFQGRRDTTAVSGTAKQFAAAQAAGRLESKRVQKEAAYAELFELLFRFRLAYADEPRPVVYQDGQGNTVYDQFSKWDFLEVDEAGNFWWNDMFTFSCDTTAPLASNRERLWQETTAFLQNGAFGDPARPATLIEYWRKMEVLHYPGAAETRKNMQKRLEEEQAQVMQAAAMQQAQADMQQPSAGGAPGGTEIPDEAVDAMAREAAMRDMGMS